MPRPPVRRTKVAQPNSKPTRVAKSQRESPRAFLARQVEQKPIGRVSVPSDESDDFVKVKKTPRNRRGVPPKDIFASGGLGEGDETAWKKRQEARKKRPSNGPPEGSELSAKKRKIGSDAEKDHTRATQSSPASEIKRGQKPSGNPVRPGHVHSQEMSSPAPSETKPRPSPLSQVSCIGAGTTSTPHIGDAVLKNVRRRPRQPSIMSNLNLPDDNTLDDNTLDDMDELDDLEPNGESTPYETSKAMTRPRSSSQTADTSTIDRSQQPSAQSSHSRPQHQAKRRTSITDPQSENSTSDEEDAALPSHRPSTPRQSNEKDVSGRRDSDTFAPPQSSSPSQNDPNQRSSSQHQRNSVKSHVTIKQDRPEASRPRGATTAWQPSTQVLHKLMPQPRKGRRVREHTPRDDFDIPEDSNNASDVSNVNDDHDSNFAVTNRKRRQTKPTRNRGSVQPSSKRGKGSIARQKRKTERSDGGRPKIPDYTSTSPSKVTPPPQRKATKQSSQQPSAQPKRRTTYTSSRRRDGTSIVESDKENRPLDILDDSSLVGGSKTAEIGGNAAQLREKFREVDDWSLSFEDVDQEGAVSSPPDQR